MTSVSWKDSVSGNWTLAADWDTGTVPGTGDEAIIAVAGPYTVSLTTPITVLSISIGATTATLAVLDPGGTDTITNGVTNAGVFNVDEGENQGGSTVAIGGTLTNTGTVDVGTSAFGDFNLSAPTTLTAAALANTGTIGIFGNITPGTANRATLNVTGQAAPGTLNGVVNLIGAALLEFASGQVGTIGGGALLNVNGNQAFVADAGATGSNSALAGLSAIAGTLDIEGGASVATTVDLNNTGTLNIGRGREAGRQHAECRRHADQQRHGRCRHQPVRRFQSFGADHADGRGARQHGHDRHLRQHRAGHYQSGDAQHHRSGGAGNAERRRQPYRRRAAGIRERSGHDRCEQVDPEH